MDATLIALASLIVGVLVGAATVYYSGRADRQATVRLRREIEPIGVRTSR